MASTNRPTVLFVCVRNAGKSQMAAALLRRAAGDAIDVVSAGTLPGEDLNALSAAAVAESGASMEGEHPKRLTQDMLRAADRVIVIGTEARMPPAPGQSAPVEVWETDEPSPRGITGEERMCLVRDDIDRRVRTLLPELLDRLRP